MSDAEKHDQKLVDVALASAIIDIVTVLSTSVRTTVALAGIVTAPDEAARSEMRAALLHDIKETQTGLTNLVAELRPLLTKVQGTLGDEQNGEC